MFHPPYHFSDIGDICEERFQTGRCRTAYILASIDKTQLKPTYTILFFFYCGRNKTSFHFCCYPYGQLWGRTKPSNTKIIQRFQPEVLRLITSALWYVTNLTLHNDLQIPFVIEEIRRLSTLYYHSVLGHNNRLVAENSNSPNSKRRLRRQWPSDLPQPADEKS
jgi:hypothetical protein